MATKKESVVLFIHGGPGLSSSYFKGWFKFLESEYDLYYYDQDYTKCKSGTSIKTLCNELLNKLKLLSIYNNIIIFAHSFGAFILLSTYEEIKKQPVSLKIKRIIISNPSDLDWVHYQEAGNHLFDDMPESTIEQLSTCTDGIEMMRIALPYYVSNHNNAPDLNFDRYDLEAYEIIDKEIEDFDINNCVKFLPPSITHVIYCENDFEKIEGSKNLASITTTHFFSNAGHFPFAEQPKEYSKLISEILAYNE